MQAELELLGALAAKTLPTEGKIKAQDSKDLSYVAYVPQEPHSCLLFYHGGGANGQAGYLVMAEQLCSQFNIATFLFDIRGHGKSAGLRGDAPSPSQVWEDVSMAIDFIRSRFKELPLFLGGHSSGAGLVVNYAGYPKAKAVEAYVLVAPELGHRAPLTKRENRQAFAKVHLPTILSHYISLGYLFQHNTAVEFSYDKKAIAEHALVTQYTVNMCLSVTPTDPSKFFLTQNEPIYIFASEADHLLDPNGMRLYLASYIAQKPNIKLEILPKGGHLMILANVHEKIGVHLNKLLETKPMAVAYSVEEKNCTLLSPIAEKSQVTEQFCTAEAGLLPPDSFSETLSSDASLGGNASVGFTPAYSSMSTGTQIFVLRDSLQPISPNPAPEDLARQNKNRDQCSILCSIL